MTTLPTRTGRNPTQPQWPDHEAYAYQYGLVEEISLEGEKNPLSRTSNENTTVNQPSNYSESPPRIRLFRLSSSNGVQVEVCSLGASLTAFRVPRTLMEDRVDCNDPDRRRHHQDDDYDDICLGYASPEEQLESQNPYYFSAVVGRVANRIAHGRFQTQPDGPIHQLALNDQQRHHLHGGGRAGGISHVVWDAALVTRPIMPHQNTTHGTLQDDQAVEATAVQFTLLSPHGDQGYPGSVRIAATYHLQSPVVPFDDGPPSDPRRATVRLALDLAAHLIEEDGSAVFSTPINLAPHFYFNLAGRPRPGPPNHSNRGILDHTLQLCCQAYTPTASISDPIPTKQVVQVQDHPVMDFRQARFLKQALRSYVAHVIGDSSSYQPEVSDVDDDEERLRVMAGVAPLGLDHNFVVDRDPTQQDPYSDWRTVAILSHPDTHRQLVLRSTAPGVQVYTANYLPCPLTDPSSPHSLPENQVKSPDKDCSEYQRWHGICLETQHFPDSILVDADQYPEYAQGACPILTPDHRDYLHCVTYDFSWQRYQGAPSESTWSTLRQFQGIDTHGQRYLSVEAMWETQGVAMDWENAPNKSSSSSWYEKAAQYYEDNCPPTVDGVLGGFASLSDLDLKGSQAFVQQIKANHCAASFDWSQGAGCECGAGIGRVSKGLLLPLGVVRCDLVESSARLLSAAPDYLGDSYATRCRYYCSGLQDWHPTTGAYSIIWIQWVLCYLTDSDVVAFLRRCGDALLEGGVIFVKENTCGTNPVKAPRTGEDDDQDQDDFIVDVDDASVTRSLPYLQTLYDAAGLTIIDWLLHEDFPSEIYPVYSFALRRHANSR